MFHVPSSSRGLGRVYHARERASMVLGNIILGNPPGQLQSRVADLSPGPSPARRGEVGSPSLPVSAKRRDGWPPGKGRGVRSDVLSSDFATALGTL